MPADLPAIHYPPELPVSAARDELARAIREHQVVVVAGATGSGKTTQLPKLCLELGRERIGHTQPRRIAARTVAERIAEELGVELGGLVGYQVRFDDRSARDTAVKIMTDGVLLAELTRDRDLMRYDTIIIDEAHERSLTIDFLLGYLTQLLPRRPDLKLIITSATIDPERFARHFADASGTPAPIVEVSGRTYPVEIRYRPLVAEAPSPAPTPAPALPPARFQAGGNGAPLMFGDTPTPAPSSLKTGKGNGGGTGRGQGRGLGGEQRQTGGTAVAEDRDPLQGVLDALDELEREGDGDVLVFFSGENEIRDAADAIRGRLAASGARGETTEVLPLYGRLSAAEQHRVFERAAPGIRRRIVLATNVAETSVTVPGIRYVVDTGTARISRYSTRAKVQRLPIEPISRASANQRAGRAGRTSAGVAIRLYSEDDFARRPEFTDPEILRTSLAAVILQMIELRLGAIDEFPFLERPDSRGVKDGLELLVELGAIEIDRTTGHHRITRIGRELARLPVDPRFGRMIVEAGRRGVAREVIAIVAGLTIQDPRERPVERRAAADASHARFTDPTSDFLTLLNLWSHLQERQRELSSSAFRRACRAEFVNYLRVREWQDLARQLRQAAKELGIRLGEGTVDPDGIHRSLLAGLLSRIGVRDERTVSTGRERRSVEFVGARQQRFQVFPGSALAKKPPAAVMAAELVETSRLFARTVAGVDPAWAEELAGELVKRSYGLPRWEQRQGSAVADEKVTLYGVPIVPKRRIQLARIDAEQARELFIRHALVGGEWPHATSGNALYDFERANAGLRRELEQLEERTRRRDLLVDDERLVDFFEARIPAEVTDVRRFERWWRTEREARPGLLTMTRAALLGDEESPATAEPDGFPSEWMQGEQRLHLAYRFEPGADDDGVTVEVPLAVLPRLEDRGFDWLVPGLREELVTALIKSLPKHVRRAVVPAGDWAKRLLAALPAHADAPLARMLADEIRRQTHTPTEAGDFALERVPAHLQMGFAAVDARGRRLGFSRSLPELQSRFAERARSSVARVAEAATPGRDLERAGLTAWPDAEVPQVVEARHGGSLVRAFPAFVDEGTSVALRVFGTREEQQREHARGVRRLLALTLPSPVSYVQDHLTPAEKLLLAASPYPSASALLDDALLAVVDEVAGSRAPFERAPFEALRLEVSAALVDGVFAAVQSASRVLEAARQADAAIRGASSLALMAPLADARAQLEALVHDGFVRGTGLAQLRRVPVYLAGTRHRVERVADNVGRDRVWQNEVEQALELFRAAGGTLPLGTQASERLVSARWMIEELRLSLFAQHLGAAGPVSVKRIRAVLSDPSPAPS